MLSHLESGKASILNESYHLLKRALSDITSEVIVKKLMISSKNEVMRLHNSNVSSQILSIQMENREVGV